MDWLEKMNKVVDYIEMNLEDSIDYEKIGQLACCSKYHFQRMFPFIAGISISEYIRRRRLTLAAFDLQTTKDKVIDIALKYGYESPDAFSRAFKAVHNIMPQSARDKGVTLKTYPKLTFNITIKGDVEMKYRIIEREAFQVFGVYALIDSNQEKAFEQVPQFFKKCDDDLVPNEINEILGRFHDNYTISALYDRTEENFKYMLCNFLPKGITVPKKFTVLDIPVTTWAIFDVPDCDMQPMWKRIYTEWFPTASYESIEGVNFEMYYGLGKHENGQGEIWIPVKAT